MPVTEASWEETPYGRYITSWRDVPARAAGAARPLRQWDYFHCPADSGVKP
jgi:hypothetical protein